MGLTERQERILKTVVDSYIASAHPVGSSAVVAASGLPVSSATVRNELGALEDLGYVRQLHTSGGRVPTNEGYRYYVERLMTPSPLPSSDAITIRHQFHQAHHEMQEWLRLAATVMATRMHNVGLVTAPRLSEVRVRHMEVISIQNSIALLIVVLQDGTVLQEMMTLPTVRTQEELSSQSDRLTSLVQGKTATQIEALIDTLPNMDAPVMEMVSHLLRRGEVGFAQVYHAGLADMIRQPEFVQHRPGEPVALATERLRHMVDFLQHGFAIQQLLSSLAGAADVQVVIGNQVSEAGLDEYSFVLGRYGRDDEGSGYLGIVGPTRLQYPRAVALVRYMTDLMTDLMQAY